MAVAVDDVVRWLGLRTVSSSEAEVLTDCVNTATAAVAERVMPEYLVEPVPAEVDQAVTLYSARLWKRRNSPEGVAGFGDVGAIRVSALDPDVELLLMRYALLDGFA